MVKVIHSNEKGNADDMMKPTNLFRSFLSSIIIMLTACFAYAAPVSIDRARQIAVNRLFVPDTALKAKGLSRRAKGIAGELVRKRQSRNIFYVLNLVPEGWVIISADDVAYPVIAYSLKGHYEKEGHPPALDYWLQAVEDEISDAVEHNRHALAETEAAWEALDNLEPLDATPVQGPLLHTTWSQGGKDRFDGEWLPSYDYYCPKERNAADEYRVAPTGCVATAMAQVMRYWSWPREGVGEHSYDPWWPCEDQDGVVCEGYGLREADFSSRTYDWQSMPDRVEHREPGNHTAGERQVQLLMSDVGVAVDMDYSPWGSGALVRGSRFPIVCDPNKDDSCDYYVEWNSSAMYAFKNFFQYSRSAAYRCKEDFPLEWTNMLETELDQRRPVIYTGSGSGSHAFVVDGYDDDGLFHVNWGWNGSFDGWYHLSDLTPESYDFTEDQCGIFGLSPYGPDLVVTHMAVEPLEPQVGQALSIDITVENRGADNAAAGFRVDWYADLDTAPGPSEGTVHAVVAEAVPAGGSYVVRLVYDGFSSPGKKRMYVQVDVTDVVAEVDEHNNIMGPVIIDVAGSTVGDLTGDDHVNMDDLSLFAKGFGTGSCTDECDGDIDGDGDMDGQDLQGIMAHFGQ